MSFTPFLPHVGQNLAADTSGLILDALAVADLSDGAGLSRAEEPLRTGGEGLLVAVLGDLDGAQAARLARLRSRTGGAIAFLLDTGTWAGLRMIAPDTGGDPFRDRVRELRAAGWTVLPVRAGDSLPDLWRAADGAKTTAPYREEAGA